MTQDLSANTLEAVRKNMTVMSFMIILFFFAGGHIPDTGVVIKLPLSNVEFDKPERLLYILWMMMVWWTYRYFALDSWSLSRKDFDDEWKLSPKNSWVISIVIDWLTDRKNTNPKMNILPASGGGYVINYTKGEQISLNNKWFEVAAWLWLRVSCPSTATFWLPLVMILVAFGLTIFNPLL